MIRSSIWLLVLLLTAKSAVADVEEDLVQAQKVLDATPAYRCTVVGGSTETTLSNRVTLEIVRPDLARIKLETDGKTVSEELGDGRKVVISKADGSYEEEPPEAAARFVMTRKQASLDEFSHMIARMKLAGHETINGIPTTLYTGEADSNLMGKMHNSVKIWISDVDHFPVQVIWKLDGTSKPSPDEEGKPFKQEAKVTFERDPSIKVVMPPGF